MDASIFVDAEGTPGNDEARMQSGDGGPMPRKAICAINIPSFSPDYREYARICLHTAHGCGYEPWLLVDGGDLSEDELRKELGWATDGVGGETAQMLRAQSRFLPEMTSALRPKELLIARGAMLRLEIPFLFDDEIVLYTDLDVMFRKGIDAMPPLPTVKYWGMVHEIRRGGMFNSGVSIMNLPNLRATADVFDTWVRRMILAGHLPKRCWDQGLINSFYKDNITTIPDEWNWRPYWGPNPDAAILHYHGPKPLDSEERLLKEYTNSGPNLVSPNFYTERERWLKLWKTLK